MKKSAPKSIDETQVLLGSGDYVADRSLATSLFLFGIAGISSLWIIKIGAFSSASVVFVVAVIVLAAV